MFSADKESVDEMEVSRDEVQTKTDKDSELEGGVPKKNCNVEPSTSSKPRSVYDMLKETGKKKEGQVKKIQDPFNRKRGHTRKNQWSSKHSLKQKRI